jgi:hypothetical protein
LWCDLDHDGKLPIENGDCPLPCWIARGTSCSFCTIDNLEKIKSSIWTYAAMAMPLCLPWLSYPFFLMLQQAGMGSPWIHGDWSWDSPRVSEPFLWPFGGSWSTTADLPGSKSSGTKGSPSSFVWWVRFFWVE